MTATPVSSAQAALIEAERKVDQLTGRLDRLQVGATFEGRPVTEATRRDWIREAERWQALIPGRRDALARAKEAERRK